MGPLTWNEIASQMLGVRNYWLHTTSPTGAPDASPVWGIVVDHGLCFYSERSTIKARNLRNNPRVLVHLESASDVLIVHGTTVDIGHPMQHDELLLAFDSKYDQPDETPFLPSSNSSFDVMYSLMPLRAIAWSLPDTEASTRRWRASSGLREESAE